MNKAFKSNTFLDYRKMEKILSLINFIEKFVFFKTIFATIRI